MRVKREGRTIELIREPGIVRRGLEAVITIPAFYPIAGVLISPIPIANLRPSRGYVYVDGCLILDLIHPKPRFTMDCGPQFQSMVPVGEVPSRTQLPIAVRPRRIFPVLHPGVISVKEAIPVWIPNVACWCRDVAWAE